MTREELMQLYTEKLRNPTPPGEAMTNALDSLTSMFATPALNQVKQGEFSYEDALNGLMAKNKDKKDWVAVVKERYPKMSPMKQKMYGTLLNMVLDPTNLVPGAMMAGEIKNVYHGSPHIFDKFSNSKIGTGEGAQAFGHGMYLTESPDIARSYAGTGKDSHVYEATIAKDRPHTMLKWEQTLDDTVTSKIRQQAEKEGVEVERSLNPSRIQALSSIKDGMELVGGGTLRLNHPQKGRGYYLDMGGKMFDLSKEDVIRLVGEPRTGAGVYSSLKNALTKQYNKTHKERISSLSDADVSAFLKRSGIDGIEYPSGSLSGIKDSQYKNYVVFDDADITINKRESR